MGVNGVSLDVRGLALYVLSVPSLCLCGNGCDGHPCTTADGRLVLYFVYFVLCVLSVSVWDLCGDGVCTEMDGERNTDDL